LIKMNTPIFELLRLFRYQPLSPIERMAVITGSIVGVAFITVEYKGNKDRIIQGLRIVPLTTAMTVGVVRLSSTRYGWLFPATIFTNLVLTVK